MLKVIAAIVPSAGLLFLFWLALRAMIEADRRERAAEAKFDRAEREAAAGQTAEGASQVGTVSAAEAPMTGAPNGQESAPDAASDRNAGTE